MASSVNLYETLKEEIIPVLHKFSQKTDDEGLLPNSYYPTGITMIPKPNEDIYKIIIDQHYYEFCDKFLIKY